MNNYIKGSFLVFVSALIFGCMPIAAKSIYQHGVNSVSLVFLRNAFCIIPLYFCVRRRGECISLSKDRFLSILIISLFGGVVTPALLFSSYSYIDSGTATTIHFIYPVFVLLGLTLFFKEPLDWLKVACVVLCTAGVFCFYSSGKQTEFLGLAFAFCSGITFAVYVIGLSKFNKLKDLSAIQLSFYMSLICATVSLPYILTTDSLALPNTITGWLYCILFSLAISLVATVCFQSGAFIVGSQRAAIFSTVEPIASIVIGVVALHESFGWQAMFGSVLILGAVFLLTIWDLKKFEKNKVHRI